MNRKLPGLDGEKDLEIFHDEDVNQFLRQKREDVAKQVTDLQLQIQELEKNIRSEKRQVALWKERNLALEKELAELKLAKLTMDDTVKQIWLQLKPHIEKGYEANGRTGYLISFRVLAAWIDKLALP